MNTSSEIVRVECKITFIDFLIGYSCVLRDYLWSASIFAFFMTALGFYATSRYEEFSLELIARSIYFFFLLVLSMTLLIFIIYYPREKVFSASSVISIANNILTEQFDDKKLEKSAESVKLVKFFYKRILISFDNGFFIIIPPDSKFLVGSKQALLDWLNQKRNTS